MEEKKGLIFIIAAMLMFGFYGIFLNAIELSPLVILFFLQVFGAIGAFFMVIYHKMKLSVKGFVLLMLGLTVTAILNDFFYFSAFKLTSVSNTLLVHYTAPIFVALFAPVLIKEKLEKVSIISLALSFVGLLIILYPNLDVNTGMLGILFALGSGLMYGLMLIAYKKVLEKLGVYVVNFYRFFLSTIILLPFVFIENPALNMNIPLLLIFGVLFGIIAVSLHIEGVKRVKAQHAGIIAYTEPVAGTVYAALFLSQMPDMFTFIGGALIVLGGYLVIRARK